MINNNYRIVTYINKITLLFGQSQNPFITHLPITTSNCVLAQIVPTNRTYSVSSECQSEEGR